MQQTLKQVLAEYGRVALAVYIAIFLAVLIGSWLAIRPGWHTENATGNVGALTAAYLATELTQPLRIAATLALTPLVAKVRQRFARSSGRSGPEGSTRPGPRRVVRRPGRVRTAHPLRSVMARSRPGAIIDCESLRHRDQ